MFICLYNKRALSPCYSIPNNGIGAKQFYTGAKYTHITGDNCHPEKKHYIHKWFYFRWSVKKLRRHFLSNFLHSLSEIFIWSNSPFRLKYKKDGDDGEFVSCPTLVSSCPGCDGLHRERWPKWSVDKPLFAGMGCLKQDGCVRCVSMIFYNYISE